MRILFYSIFITYFIFGQTNEITFTEHISEIIYNKCTECHRSGESGPMAFTSYDEIASMSQMIKAVTQDNYMPPWPPDPN